MKTILWVAVSAALLSACAATGPQTAWGKPGVTKVEYVTDLGMCTGLAAMTQGGNAANTAGGINGQNNSANNGLSQPPAPPPAGGAGDSPSSSAGAAVPTGGGGMYRDSAPQDVVNRAATQQQSQQMAAKRARAEAMKSCYVERGYQEFTLTPEQRAHLGTLKPGTNEYLQYLSTIGTDPAVVKSPPAPR